MGNPELTFEGRVALVTGGGAGLGLSHALLLAERGATVVVNDLGTAVDGTGASMSRAEAVVEEIRSRGGIAIADHHSVSDCDGALAMVELALNEFNRIDIVVNNAGILRDATIQNASPESVEAVFDVHLKGAFNVVRASWRHMRDRGYGRIVNTSSNSGILGNFGQSSYAAAKMGLVGLTKVLALEGAKVGIQANAVAPMAQTRMTEDLMGPDVALLTPALVSPVVAWLAHETCDLSGETISAGGGHVARFFIGLTRGWMDPALTIEDVAEHMEEVCDPSDYRILDSGVEQIMTLFDEIRGHASALQSQVGQR